MNNPFSPVTNWIRSRWTQLLAWIKLWPDLPAEFLGIGLFILSAPLFGWVANYLGAPEAGILQNLVILGVEIAFINAIVFVGIVLNFKIIFDWYKKPHAIEKDWFSLTPWQRFTTFLILYCSLFISGVLLIASLQ